MKEYIKSTLATMEYPVEDMGTHSTESVDYPDYAEKVSRKVVQRKDRRGVLVCGSGVGASIAANKVPGARAALVHDVRSAQLSREHNDSNILVLSGWNAQKRKVKQILKTWLTTKFSGGRHLRRLKKISKIEKKYMK